MNQTKLIHPVEFFLYYGDGGVVRELKVLMRIQLALPCLGTHGTLPAFKGKTIRPSILFIRDAKKAESHQHFGEPQQQNIIFFSSFYFGWSTPPKNIIPSASSTGKKIQKKKS